MNLHKQEDYPRYHAKDIAEWRSHHQCPLVLGSTPSLNHNVLKVFINYYLYRIGK